MESPSISYVRSGEVYLAYEVFGSGSVPLVTIPGRLSNLELSWDDPDRAAFFEGLGTFARVVLFDKRGVGVSDRVAGIPTLEQQVEDVLAVMEAAGVARAFLFGTQDGTHRASRTPSAPAFGNVP